MKQHARRHGISRSAIAAAGPASLEPYVPALAFSRALAPPPPPPPRTSLEERGRAGAGAARAGDAALYDQAPVPLCLVDGSGVVLEANRAATLLLGIERARARGTALPALFVAREQQTLQRRIDLCVKHGVDFSLDGTLDGARGGGEPGRSARHVRLRGVVCQSPDDGAAACHLAISDAGELRRLEERQVLLANATNALASSFEYAATISAVVRQLVPGFADICFVDVVHAGGAAGGQRQQRSEVAVADIAVVGAARHLKEIGPQLAPGSPLRVVLDESACICAEHCATAAVLGLDALAPAERAAFPARARAMLLVPLVSDGRAIGVLTAIRLEGGSGAARRFEADDVAFARLIAVKMAAAIDRGESYRAAADAVAARDELLAVVSHDLRTPLSSIALNASLLLQQVPPTVDRRDGRRRIESIERGVTRMSRLVDDLLEATRPPAQQAGGAARCAVDVRALLEEAIEPLLELAARKGVALKLDVRAEGGADDAGVGDLGVGDLGVGDLGVGDLGVGVDVDPGRGALALAGDREALLRVLTNLVGNALSFTPSGGRIDVSCRRRGSVAELAVADSGPGIAAADLPRIFDRFWRGARSRGCGLGLYIARRIVEEHGGTMSVASKPGAGARFVFTVPVAAPALPQQCASSAPSSPASSSSCSSSSRSPSSASRSSASPSSASSSSASSSASPSTSPSSASSSSASPLPRSRQGTRGVPRA